MRDQVFVSYSHRDAAWLERLQVYLSPFERRGQVRRWDDTLIAPGRMWEQEILDALARAKVAVLLVSADFLASDFIARVELPRLLGAAEDEGVTIIPLVLDACNFERIPELAQFQSVNQPSQPLETLDTSAQKAVLAKLAAAIADALAAEVSASGNTTAAERGRFVGLPARNPLFTGRDAVLAALRDTLAGGARAALCGLPGIGKTESAIEFAHRNRHRYAWVLWTRAESPQQLTGGFCAIADALALPEAKGSDQLAAAQAARAALAARSDWLLVFDSSDDLGLIRDWLPPGAGGSVLLTSRSSALTALAQPFELDPLDDSDGARFLLKRTRLLPPDGAAADTLMAEAMEISHQAGGLPLALEQAGSYIEETGCSLQDYSALWRDHRCQLLAERGEGSLRASDSVIEIWSLSLAELQRANPDSVFQLYFLAFFHCDALPDAALAPGAQFAGPELSPLLANALARNEALRDALRFAFLRRDAKTRKLAMHRLVQAVLRDGLGTAGRQLWCQRGIDVLNAILPNPRFTDWAQWDSFAAHVLSLLACAADAGIETLASTRLACELGAYFCQRGRYAEARPLAMRALTARQSAAAAASPQDQARALSVCGQIALGAGMLDEARQHLDGAIKLLADGDATIDLAGIMDIRATVDVSAGDLVSADSRLNAAYAMASATGEAHSPEAAQIANDLGAVRFKRGDYGNARLAFETAAQLRQELLPPNHPSIAQSLNNLAAVCARLGEHAAARDRYMQALAIRQAAFGERHPDVAETLLNLALLDLADGRPNDARSEAEHAVAIVEACYGNEHAAVAKARACLGDVALGQGALDEAQSLYERARAIRSQVLGAQHPDTARASIGLADVALARGEFDAAVTLLTDACAILRNGLGRNHPDVGACEVELRRARAGRASQPPAPTDTPPRAAP